MSVSAPESPMELSLAVNVSLAALQKYSIFYTETFRTSPTGRAVCCFDKTGAITAENLVDGVADIE